MKLLETSYLVDFEHGAEPARQYFEAHEHESLAVSTVSVFELGFGIVRQNQSALEKLLPTLQWAELLDYTPQDAIDGALIQSELEGAGQRIPIADSMIAGVARNRGATLVTRDEHFEEVDGLSVEYYREES